MENIKILIIFLIYIFLIKVNFFKNKPLKISIYLPIYNKEIYLLKSIKSVQKQSYKNIEIIAVNDYSTDNSYKVINELSKIDSRIKIINNTKNHGLLYTRAMGILYSSGQYLLNLDPDDELYNNNDLEYLYNIIKKLKVDIISFAYLEKNDLKLKCLYINKISIQPKIFKSSFDSGTNNLNDYILWNKLVKRSLLIKVYKIFKTKIFSNNKWNYGEDTIWSLLINKYAKSMLCINKTIYLYKKNNNSLMNNRGNIVELNNRIYILEMYIEILKNKKELKYINSHIIQFIDEISNQNLLNLIKNNSIIKCNIIKILLFSIQKYNSPYIVIQKIQNFLEMI